MTTKAEASVNPRSINRGPSKFRLAIDPMVLERLVLKW